METIKPQGYRFHKTGSASPIHPNNSSTSLSRSNSSNNIRLPSNSTDPKLNQIVRKIISTTPSLLVNSNSKNNAAARNATNAIVDIIYEKHREYRRKEREVVVKGVDIVIGEILAENNNNSNNSNSSTSGKKRRVAVGGGSDPEVENESKRIKGEGVVSAIHLEASDLFVVDRQPIISGGELDKGSEAAEETTNNQGGGMLNASLRNRYKEQREKEIIANNTHAAALSSCASVESKEVDSVDGDDVRETPMKTGETEKQTLNSNNTDTTTPNNTTPKKKKKIKRTPSKSSTFESADPTISSNNLIVLPTPRPTERYSTLGGISKLLTTIRQLIEYPLSHPELFTHLGIEPPRGVLLRGPPVSVSLHDHH